MTNTPINLGQSLVRGCSSFRRSTEWSVNFVNILNGSLTSILIPSRSSRIWFRRTLLALAPTLPRFFPPFLNLLPPLPTPFPQWLVTIPPSLSPPLTPYYWSPSHHHISSTKTHNLHTSPLPGHPTHNHLVDWIQQAQHHQCHHWHQLGWLMTLSPSQSLTTSGMVNSKASGVACRDSNSQGEDIHFCNAFHLVDLYLDHLFCFLKWSNLVPSILLLMRSSLWSTVMTFFLRDWLACSSRYMSFILWTLTSWFIMHPQVFVSMCTLPLIVMCIDLNFIQFHSCSKNWIIGNEGLSRCINNVCPSIAMLKYISLHHSCKTQTLCPNISPASIIWNLVPVLDSMIKS